MHAIWPRLEQLSRGGVFKNRSCLESNEYTSECWVSSKSMDFCVTLCTDTDLHSLYDREKNGRNLPQSIS